MMLSRLSSRSLQNSVLLNISSAAPPSTRSQARGVHSAPPLHAHAASVEQTYPSILPTPASFVSPSAQSNKGKFDYTAFAQEKIEGKKRDGSYRYFTNINRIANRFPSAKAEDGTEVTIWCSNDYLGMGSSPLVIDAIKKSLDETGAGAGGSRNIGGNGAQHIALEAEIASLHAKSSSLVFNSGYTAQQAPLEALGTLLPNCVIFSDALNHASMIHGIRNAKCRKVIFAHNDIIDLEFKLREFPRDTPKIIAIESIYSMCGSIAPLEAICDLAEQYGALLFVDEVHAVGAYGPTGAGLAEHLDWMAEQSGLLESRRKLVDRVDIVSATLGKSFGVIGGYMAASAPLVDLVRSFASSFIFTTSAPPALMAGVRASIKHQRSQMNDRIRLQKSTKTVKNALKQKGIPVMPNPTHIIPVLVGDPVQTRRASDMLLSKHEIYVQAINFPTVAEGTERLRISSSARHEAHHERKLVTALEDVWSELGLNRVKDWEAKGGRAGVGMDEAGQRDIWTNEQLSC